MAALQMTPGIVWNWPLVGASALIAVSASAVALNVFKWFRGGKRSPVWQLVAALVLGAAICGMHYTGMGAAEFPGGAVCLSAGGLNGERLGMLVTVSSLMLLTMTLYASTFHAPGGIAEDRQ